MQTHTDAEVGIIGGGLAGLCLSIQLARAGRKVILFEKKQYPFHKVCGEYIAIESWGFLERLGVPLSSMNLPIIKRLNISAPNGRMLSQSMATGGFGISRYTLDNYLASLALQAGVQILSPVSVQRVEYGKNQTEVTTDLQTLKFKVVCGSYGKRSNIDLQLKRKFANQTKQAARQYIGVKYHLEIDFPDDLIELHNFKDGYCGISKVDQQRYCLCYLTTAQNLKENENSIELLEKNILHRNPFLRKCFLEGKFLYDKPLSISQISFAKKPLIENHLLMLGDAAGMIAPLCGNGMTMAMQASHLLAPLLIDFLSGKTSREALEKNYASIWNKTFSTRLKAGRNLQYLFGDPFLTNAVIALLQPFPGIVKGLISLTHGKPF